MDTRAWAALSRRIYRRCGEARSRIGPFGVEVVYGEAIRGVLDYLDRPLTEVYRIALGIIRRRVGRLRGKSEAMTETDLDVPVDQLDRCAKSGDLRPPAIDWESAERRLVNMMAPTPGRVLLLRCRDGLSYRQISKRLGITVNAARCHRQRALEKLRSAAERSNRPPPPKTRLERHAARDTTTLRRLRPGAPRAAA